MDEIAKLKEQLDLASDIIDFFVAMFLDESMLNPTAKELFEKWATLRAPRYGIIIPENN